MNNERVTTFPFDPTEFPFNIEMSGITNCDEKYEVLNYADQPHFSNAFKKVMGISPEKYRKMNIKVNQRQSNIHNKYAVEATENLPFDLKVERH